MNPDDLSIQIERLHTVTTYDVVPKEEIAEFEELMRKTIADIVSEASSVACWVYVQKRAGFNCKIYGELTSAY